MKQRLFNPVVIRERLKQYIASNCRSDLPVRNKGMEILAVAVGVYTNPSTLEMDLWDYVDQLVSPMLIRELFKWSRDVAIEHVIPEMPNSLPQFQLELA